MAGTRAQSGDRYGSGTLYSRQFLRGRLPLLSPAFRRSHFSPLGASTRKRHERPLSAKDGIMGEKWPVNFACDFDFHVNPGFSDMPRKSATWETALLPPQGRHAVDFFARKIRRLRPGSNPRSWVPEASMLTTRPPKVWVYQSTNWDVQQIFLLTDAFHIFFSSVWSSRGFLLRSLSHIILTLKGKNTAWLRHAGVTLCT